VSILTFGAATAWGGSGSGGSVPQIDAIEFQARVRPAIFKIQGTAETLTVVEARDGKLSISIDPKSLRTGLSLRDSHMIEKIFTSSKGEVLPITFVSQDAAAEGQLSFRGVTRQFKFGCKERVCVGTIKLSDFEVAPIKHLGVGVEDAVEVTVKLKP
jgi:hypothetical protein